MTDRMKPPETRKERRNRLRKEKAFLQSEQKRLQKEHTRKNLLKASAQSTLGFSKIYEDGICRIDPTTYSKTIEFQDINYALAQKEVKAEILDAYCGFLNFFTENTSFSLTFFNQSGGYLPLINMLEIYPQGDYLDSYRAEYSNMLKNQIQLGNNEIYRRKFITITVNAPSYEEARPQLERMTNGVLGNFSAIGVAAYSLNGASRVQLLHDILHCADEEELYFDWSMVTEGGNSEKDFIAPASMNFSNPRLIRLEDWYCSTSFLNIVTPELGDDFLGELINQETTMLITIHAKPMNYMEAIKMVKGKLSDVEKMRAEENKKALRSGYDIDILPPDLQLYQESTKKLLQRVEGEREQVFYVSFLVTLFNDSVDDLKQTTKGVEQICRKHACSLRPLDFQQEFALNSVLPIGKNDSSMKRLLTTTSLAVFIPFTTQELFDVSSPSSLYYGLNALSNNMILLDRKKLRSPNGLILGTTGSGKSFSAKREIVNAVLVTNDDIVIVDPEGEYEPLVRALGGEIIPISANSKRHINPMDIDLGIYDEDNPDPIRTKAEFVLSMFEIIGGGVNGLTGEEISIIDRCVQLVYRPYMQEPKRHNIPTLGDLYKLLHNQPEPQATRLASILEIYVTGSLNVFNNQTNIDSDNRIVCFVIKELSETLKKLAMLIVQETIWSRVAKNKSYGITTRYYIDEFHLLLRDPQTAAYFVNNWKRLRKWNGAPTGITQNVKDFLQSPEIENIFDNTDFFYLLNQNSGDQQILAKRLNISDQQIAFVKNAQEGTGLIIYDGAIVPFVDRFPTGTMLYQLMTTKPTEIN